jgi:hypothetical protein
MKVRYLWRKSDTPPWYCCRKFPDDIKAILERRGEPTPAFRTNALRTRNDTLAVKLVCLETRKDDECFYQLREGTVTSQALKLAEKRLNEHGLKNLLLIPGSRPVLICLFITTSPVRWFPMMAIPKTI